MKDGFVIKKPEVIHSRARARVAHEAKVKGRHTGPGVREMGGKPILMTKTGGLICERWRSSKCEIAQVSISMPGGGAHPESASPTIEAYINAKT